MFATPRGVGNCQDLRLDRSGPGASERPPILNAHMALSLLTCVAFLCMATFAYLDATLLYLKSILP